MPKIDRDTPIPAYYQIQMDLTERIKRGEWDRTRRLPSESALATYYDVSRITLRQALAELEKDGIIKKARGRSAEICESPKPFVHKLNYALVSANHTEGNEHSITAEMLSIKRFDTPYEAVQDALQIGPNEPVVYMKRLFSLDGKPLAVGRSWLSLSRFPQLDVEGLPANQLTNTLKEKYHVIPVRVDDGIEAVRPTPSDLEQLEMTYDCPLLCVRGISYDRDNVPIEYSTTLWLGDRVRFQISLPL